MTAAISKSQEATIVWWKGEICDRPNPDVAAGDRFCSPHVGICLFGSEPNTGHMIKLLNVCPVKLMFQKWPFPLITSQINHKMLFDWILQPNYELKVSCYVLLMIIMMFKNDFCFFLFLSRHTRWQFCTLTPFASLKLKTESIAVLCVACSLQTFWWNSFAK